MGGSRRPRGYILILNATTIIVLRELERLSLIERLRGLGNVKVVIPQAVKHEFLRAGVKLDIPSDEVTVEYRVDELQVDIPRSLGEGERQAIEVAYALTREPSENVVIVVTDDKRARHICKRLGVKVTGTLGLIEFAKRNDVISKEEALELLGRIPSTSLHITPELLEEAQARIRQQ